MARIEHLKIIRLKIAELSEQTSAEALSNAFSNKQGVASVEINSSNATVVIAYDDTLTSIFDIEAVVYGLKFKLEGISYLSQLRSRGNNELSFVKPPRNPLPSR